MRLQTAEGIETVLEHVNVDIEEGSFTVLVGANGSGKSTLLQVIAGLCPLSKGNVSFGGAELRTGVDVYMALQNPDAQIIGGTPYEDVCFSLELRGLAGDLLEEKANAALELVGLQRERNRPIDELSGGQKQLVSMASALAVDARIIVFDEPTAMLDSSARADVLHAALRLRDAGRTVIWATHALDEAGYADRVIALERGRVRFDGAAEAFFYGAHVGKPEAAPCCMLGFQPPYLVEMVHHLLRGGAELPLRPVVIEQWEKAVAGLCR